RRVQLAFDYRVDELANPLAHAASIGSNQSSKRYTAVSATGCEEIRPTLKRQVGGPARSEATVVRTTVAPWGSAPAVKIISTKHRGPMSHVPADPMSTK